MATKVAEWTDSGRLFQREGAQELQALAPVLVLILGTDRVIPLFDFSERDGSEVATKSGTSLATRVSALLCSSNARDIL